MKKTILITGGSGKIGGQLVNHFLREGWRVYYTSRNKNSLELLAERFELAGTILESLTVIPVDFYDPKAVEHIREALRGEELNVLVNNARDLGSLAVRANGLTARKQMQEEYLVDVIVPYELATELIQSHPLSSIINIGSIYGVVPFNPHLYGDRYPAAAPIQYSLAKAAINHLTRELAVRFRGRCQVNTVSYGGVLGRVDDDFLARYAKLCPEETMLDEEQTVGPVAFLVSPASRGITGQNIIQDGGWTVW